MIKATEFRIGNIIYDTKGEVNTIDLTALKYISDYEGIHQAKPIPLTEEWLLKFGFKKGESGHFALKKLFLFSLQEHTLSLEYETDSMYFMICIAENINHIHQLQNLYFALTGEELTINQPQTA